MSSPARHKSWRVVAALRSRPTNGTPPSRSYRHLRDSAASKTGRPSCEEPAGRGHSRPNRQTERLKRPKKGIRPTIRTLMVHRPPPGRWPRRSRWAPARSLGHRPQRPAWPRLGQSARKALQASTTSASFRHGTCKSSRNSCQTFGSKSPMVTVDHWPIAAGMGEADSAVRADHPHNPMNTRQRRLELADSSRRFFLLAVPRATASTEERL